MKSDCGDETTTITSSREVTSDTSEDYACPFSGSSFASSIQFDLKSIDVTPGTPLYVGVTGRTPEAQGNFELTFLYHQNSKCADATLVFPQPGAMDVVTTTYTGSTLTFPRVGDAADAASDGDSLQASCDAPPPGSAAGWYRITGTGSKIRVTTCSEVTDFPTQITLTSRCGRKKLSEEEKARQRARKKRKREREREQKNEQNNNSKGGAADAPEGSNRQRRAQNRRRAKWGGGGAAYGNLRKHNPGRPGRRLRRRKEPPQKQWRQGENTNSECVLTSTSDVLCDAGRTSPFASALEWDSVAGADYWIAISGRSGSDWITITGRSGSVGDRGNFKLTVRYMGTTTAPTPGVATSADPDCLEECLQARECLDQCSGGNPMWVTVCQDNCLFDNSLGLCIGRSSAVEVCAAAGVELDD